MADKAITYGASEGFGAVAGWNAKKTSSALAQERKTAHDDKGDEVASKLVGGKTEVSSDYECELDANTIPASIGALVNDLILTEIAITTDDNAAKMSLRGHNHSANAHAVSPALRTALHAITVAKAFGATDFTGATAGTDSGIVSGGITIKCDHNDQDDGDGNHLAGENCNFIMEAKSTHAGIPSVNAVAGWDITVVSTEDEATGFVKTVVTGIQKLVAA